MKKLSLNSIGELSDGQRDSLARKGIRTVGELYALVVDPSLGEPLRALLHLDIDQALALRRLLEECLTEKERQELSRSFDVSKRLGALLENGESPRKAQ